MFTYNIFTPYGFCVLHTYGITEALYKLNVTFQHIALVQCPTKALFLYFSRRVIKLEHQSSCSPSFNTKFNWIKLIMQFWWKWRHGFYAIIIINKAQSTRTRDTIYKITLKMVDKLFFILWLLYFCKIHMCI